MTICQPLFNQTYWNIAAMHNKPDYLSASLNPFWLQKKAPIGYFWGWIIDMCGFYICTLFCSIASVWCFDWLILFWFSRQFGELCSDVDLISRQSREKYFPHNIISSENPLRAQIQLSSLLLFATFLIDFSYFHHMVLANNIQDHNFLFNL